jgi:hypothetical protein
MIHKALQFTTDILDQFVKNEFGLDESKVLLHNLVGSDGLPPEANRNKVVISLINIEKETAKAFFEPEQRAVNGDYANVSLPERFNLDLLISSNFDDYGEALKLLDAVILFFQVNTVIHAASFSNIPPGIATLDFNLEKLTYNQMQGLWMGLGATYKPSIIYKMRLTAIPEQKTAAAIPLVRQVSNGGAV